MNSTQPHLDDALLAPPRRQLYTLLLLAGIVGLVLRLVCFSCPPYDSHSFRQTQTLSTIETFYHEGVDIFHAKAIYMGYPGVFVLEVPVFQAFCAWLYRLFGPHWEIVRAVNICLGAGSAWLVYKISLRFFAPGIAALSAIIYWLAPLNI